VTAGRERMQHFNQRSDNRIDANQTYDTANADILTHKGKQKNNWQTNWHFPAKRPLPEYANITQNVNEMKGIVPLSRTGVNSQ